MFNKKFAALTLAATMTLGMASTVYAGTITINNADKANKTVVQVIYADRTTRTGWNIVDDYAKIFEDKLNVTDEQSAIEAYTSDSLTAAKEAEILDAITATFTDSTVSANLNNASEGLYVIKATEDGYAYDSMSAYVGFDAEDAVVNAKKADIKIDKTNTENDFVEIDEVVEYTLTTTVPYFSKDQDAASYTITDTITGADYVTTDGALTLTYTIGSEEAKTTTVTPANGSFTLVMKDIVGTDNAKANQALVIKYSAKVTAQYVENSVVPAGGDHTYTPAVDKLYTGSVSVTKYASDNNNNDLSDNTKLDGAEFVLYKKVDDVKTYATLNNGVVTGWTTDITKAGKVTTAKDTGVASVAGLDNEETYFFQEVTAPVGYSLNETDVQVTWGDVVTDATTNAKSVAGATTMVDTKLLALPATGGIGTTIFTVLGCLLMIGAVALFFVNRRKADR